MPTGTEYPAEPMSLCPPTPAEQIGNLQARVAKLEGHVQALFEMLNGLQHMVLNMQQRETEGRKAELAGSVPE